MARQNPLVKAAKPLDKDTFIPDGGIVILQGMIFPRPEFYFEKKEAS